MRKAIIIIIIAMVTVVTSFTTVTSSFAETQDYYYFETSNNIYGFGINECNQYYTHNFTTPVNFVIENGNIPNEDIKDMINNNPVFEQRLISQSGIFTYDLKLYLKSDSFSFTSASYAYTSSSVDTDGNDIILRGENKIIAGTAVNVNRIEVFISYNDYYLDVNHSNSDSFYRTYNNSMAKNKYWSISPSNYGFYGDSFFNVVDFDDITSNFFLNMKKNSRLKNDIKELTDETMFIFPFSTEATNGLYRNYIYDIFGAIGPISNRAYFNTDTIISGYINVDGVPIERNAQYVGINEVNNRQIWKLELPISLDVNSLDQLELTARKNGNVPNMIATIIPLPNESIIINNEFTWGSLLELSGIFGVAVDLILQILNYEILGIELGFLIFAPLLFTISLGIIKRIRG